MSFLLSDNRHRLSGMVIQGDGKDIYTDHSHKTTCPWYPQHSGLDVCSAVIMIPIEYALVRHLKISTANFLTLCEVEVYEGKKSLNTLRMKQITNNIR